MPVRRTVVLSALALLVGVPAAWADSKLSVRGGIFYFVNEDAGIANRLAVDNDARGRLHFFDDADPYGMNFPTPPCSPGRVNSAGNPIEVFCAKDGSYRNVTVQSGPAEDRVVWKADDMPVTLDGEDGADTLTGGGAADALGGGQGDDTLVAGAGNDEVLGDDGNDSMDGGVGDDTVNGGPGNDAFGGGEGNDTIQASDGYTDAVDCGAGEDTAVLDQLDTVAGCEHVTRQQVTPVPGQAGPRDTTDPALRVGGSTSQRARHTFKVLATASEPSIVDASGYLQAGGINTKLKAATAKVKVGGGGATLRLGLSKRMVRLVKRDLRRHRHPRARVTVSAVDPAGNTSRPRRIWISFR
jgi:Ca2+-binding RTX toxin-like protein